MENTKVIVIVSKKLGKTVYKRKEEAQPTLSPSDETMKPKVNGENEIFEDILLDKEHPSVEPHQANQDAVDAEYAPEPSSSIYSVHSPVSCLKLEEEEIESTIKPKKKKGLFQKSESRKKATKSQSNKTQRKESKTSVSKADIKGQFQKSEKVKKASRHFSLFEPVVQEESIEDKIKQVLNEDGYYNVMSPVEDGKNTKLKKERNIKQLALIGALILVATVILGALISQIGGFFE